MLHNLHFKQYFDILNVYTEVLFAQLRISLKMLKQTIKTKFNMQPQTSCPI